jgi:hypothetical protein
VTPEGRTTIVDGARQKTTLKTGFRPRLLPLHRAQLDEGFLDYVAEIRARYGDTASLFPDVPAG